MAIVNSIWTITPTVIWVTAWRDTAVTYRTTARSIVVNLTISQASVTAPCDTIITIHRSTGKEIFKRERERCERERERGRFERSTGGPGSPGGPDVPRSPVGPLGPDGPGSPCIPGSPWKQQFNHSRSTISWFLFEMGFFYSKVNTKLNNREIFYLKCFLKYTK